MTDPKEWTNPALTPYAAVGESLALPGPVLVGLVREVLARGRAFRFSAPGASMRPFIRSGDVITLAPCSPGGPFVGDIVAFCRPGTDRLVVHRLVRIGAGGLYTRGDGCLDEDEPISREAVLAIVTHVERGGRVVRLGLGPERAGIALLSRRGLLPPLVRAGSRARALIGGAHD